MCRNRKQNHFLRRVHFSNFDRLKSWRFPIIFRCDWIRNQFYECPAEAHETSSPMIIQYTEMVCFVECLSIVDLLRQMFPHISFNSPLFSTQNVLICSFRYRRKIICISVCCETSFIRLYQFIELNKMYQCIFCPFIFRAHFRIIFDVLFFIQTTTVCVVVKFEIILSLGKGYLDAVRATRVWLHFVLTWSQQ